jgi:hypothetical protein
MGKPAKRVFISYETETGLAYARQAKLILTKAGYLAWMWESDNTPGAYPMDDIANNIANCDIFLYLCTCPEPPGKWNGQPYECNLAWEFNKSPRVLTFDPNMIHPALRAYTYVVVSVDTFAITEP